ncbi:hypothetical protein SAMN06297358_1366 [Pedobacter xixiisoli]|uniref:Uncharacterized protein n=1 Tax=Pedobacter xixiisoli TaxID=1476464 RepID=A0A285ZWN5_9SPHI|nr:hypothetical protein SAMN06297358_1366 [Pedobacter xixiisoli]
MMVVYNVKYPKVQDFFNANKKEIYRNRLTYYHLIKYFDQRLNIDFTIKLCISAKIANHFLPNYPVKLGQLLLYQSSKLFVRNYFPSPDLYFPESLLVPLRQLIYKKTKPDRPKFR